MKETVNVSVAMAVYNGTDFLCAQIDSILAQLGPEDELVISDDGSTDETMDILQRYVRQDRRIRMFRGPGKGIPANFGYALTQTRGRYIFLADQDDIWMDGKVQKVLQCFENPDVVLVLHDAIVTDEELNTRYDSFFAKRGSRIGFMRNLIKNSYMGCCMALRSSLLPAVLPMPSEIPMHDQWIGLIAERMGMVHLLREPLLKYRRHAKTVTTTVHGTIFAMVKSRLNMAWCVARRLRQLRRAGTFI